MKKDLLIFIIKFLLTTFCITYSFFVNAQSIIGRWKLTDAKETIMDKSTGKIQDLAAQIKPVLKMMEQVFIFNADNTYSFSNGFTGSLDKMQGSGTYNVLGNQLK